MGQFPKREQKILLSPLFGVKELSDAESQFLAQGDEGSIIRSAQITHETAAAANHLEQAAAGSLVLFIGAQMIGQILDALGQHCDLDFG